MKSHLIAAENALGVWGSSQSRGTEFQWDGVGVDLGGEIYEPSELVAFAGRIVGRCGEVFGVFRVFFVGDLAKLGN